MRDAMRARVRGVLLFSVAFMKSRAGREHYGAGSSNLPSCWGQDPGPARATMSASRPAQGVPGKERRQGSELRDGFSEHSDFLQPCEEGMR